jgi:hypothetical protein
MPAGPPGPEVERLSTRLCPRYETGCQHYDCAGAGFTEVFGIDRYGRRGGFQRSFPG